MPTATAAAGVESFINQLSISSKAELSLLTILGSPKQYEDKVKFKNNKIFIKINVKNIKKINFLNLILKIIFKIWQHF